MGIMPIVETTPDDLLDSLAFSLLKQRGALKRIGGKAKHEPAMDDCLALARELVEDLKRAGVEKILRRHAAMHSAPAPDAGRQ